jgi:hypothetical protein
MSRFKFVCSCGKRLAAYDWMVGQVINCPKCGNTLTVSTPFQGEEKLAEMIEKGYSPTRRRFGKPFDPNENRHTGLLIFGLVAAVVVLACVVYLLFGS